MTQKTQITKYYVGLHNSDMDKQTVKPGNVVNYIVDHFRGATIYESKGVWKGAAENSMVIEIVGDIEEEVTNNSLSSLIQKEKNKEKDSKEPHIVVKESLEDIFNQDSVMTIRDRKEVNF